MANDTPSSQNPKKSNISSIKQTGESVPQEVKELYNKTPKSRQALWKKKYDPAANRVDNYFKKKLDERSSTFDTHRQSAMNTNFISEKSIKPVDEDEDFKKAQQASGEAKATALEINTALSQKVINQTELLKLNTKMMLQLQKAHDLLSSALIKRDNDLRNQFTSKLNEATGYVSKELNLMRDEIEELKKNDDVEKLTTINACKDDLKKLWIRFTYKDDVNQYREKRNPPLVMKDILNQLSININKIQWPIETASFQTRKFSQDQLPETALECTFINSTIANKVKYAIINFNNQLEGQGKTNLIRYRVATDWSYHVRRVLKYCNEMRKCGVINKVVVTNDGIKVFHKEMQRKYTARKAAIDKEDNIVQYSNTRIATSTYVNSIIQLDLLRKDLQDYNFNLTAIEVYNEKYYAKPFDDRLKIRKEFDALVDAVT